MDKIAPTPPSNPTFDAILASLASAPLWARRRYLRLQGYPRFLYKYRLLDTKSATSISRLRDLVISSRFWLSSPTEFNDPFDMSSRVVFEGTPAEKRARMTKVVKKRGGIKSSKDQRAKINQLTKRSNARHLANVTLALESARVETGVYSFAGDPRSILMWSHYGKDHEGLCLQFDIARDPTTFLRAVHVDYAEDYPVMNFMQETQPQVKVALLRKFKQWKYEKEQRIIVPQGAHCHQPFRPEALSSIVFGCRATTDVKEKMHEILEERDKLGMANVKTYDAKKHSERYALVIQRP